MLADLLCPCGSGLAVSVMHLCGEPADTPGLTFGSTMRWFRCVGNLSLVDLISHLIALLLAWFLMAGSGCLWNADVVVTCILCLVLFALLFWSGESDDFRL
jgi:hypothetical protein